MSDMMKVIIGYDGSSSSDNIVEDLKRAGLPRRLKALVITAVDVFYPNWIDMTGSGQTMMIEELEMERKQALTRAQVTAQKEADRLHHIFPLWTIQAEALEDSPVHALIKKADTWKADLIVVGAQGHASLGRFMGSVSQLVLMQAPCSVRISRAPLDLNFADGVLKIILAVDGSAPANKAAQAVKNREWPASTQVHVLSTITHHLLLESPHFPPVDPRVVESVSGQERLAITKKVQDWAAELRHTKLASSAFIRDGDPKHILVNEAQEWKADCIFMGARGLSPVRRFFLGSVSMAVAARAHCSVEVVRTPSTAEETQ